MLSGKKKAAVSAFLILFLAAAVIHLMLLRHKTGDIYPPYSSLRSDPLGVKIFFESLKAIKSLTVSRNYKPLKKIRHNNESTLFYPGVNHEYAMIYDETYKVLEDMVINGNRIVFSFFPVSETDGVNYENLDNDSNCNTGSECTSKDISSKTSGNKFKSFSERLGFDFNINSEAAKPFADCAVCDNAEANNYSLLELPKSVIMPTALFFDKPDDSWRVIYARAGKAVLMEKIIGKGSIVLCAGSFFLSNEAMLRYRYPELLSWLIGSSRKVIFDEKHHGIEETEGVATLARKYRLHGLFAGFIVLAGLFIWQNAFPLLPRRNTISRDKVSIQQNYIQGLIYLLRRSIPSRDILNVCFQEWKKSNSILSIKSQDHIHEISHIIESADLKNEQSVIKTYKRVNQFLTAEKLKIKRVL